MMDVVGCPVCGAVLDETDVGKELHQLRAHNQQLLENQDDLIAKQDELKFEVDVLKAELSAKLRKIKKIQKEMDAELPRHRYYQVGVEVLKEWSKLCHPGAKALTGGERMKLVLARLEEDYSKDQLVRCAYGFSVFRYVRNGQRHTRGVEAEEKVDAVTIYQDPKRVDDGLRYADQADRMSQSVPALDQPAPERDLSAYGSSALKLAEFGFHVFPVQPKGKIPATRNGFQDATRDANRISNFWALRPDHNLGVRTGKESEIIVLDVDCGGDDRDDGFETLSQLEKRFEKLPRTLTVVTPRGGTHFYFRHPGFEVRNTQGFPGPGLDLRGDGGYVLAPPSLGPNGRHYEVDERAPLAEAPSWLLKVLVENQSRLSRSISSKDYEAIVNKGARSGERNASILKLAGHLWNRLEPGLVLGICLNTNRAFNEPLSEDEVEKIVLSVQRMRARDSLKRLKDAA